MRVQLSRKCRTRVATASSYANSLAKLVRAGCRSSSIPSVSVADFDHRGEDRVPGLLIFQHGVGKHAAVPADVAETAAVGAAEPVAGCFDDVELAVGVVGW